jgi:dihydroxy-acid dehydratase
VGGPLSLVKDGDEIELSVKNRSLTLHVSETELLARRAAPRTAPQRYVRGYGRLFMDHINQADQGCDFDFLEGTAPTPEPAIN